MLPYGVSMVAWVRGAVLLGLCSGCAPAGSDTESTALRPSSVPAATELAESQISASTVAAPAIPEPCEPAELEVQAVDPGAEADQVIGLINRADEACEVDVSSSPGAAEDLEPNVVLGPGEVAYLWISGFSECEDSRAELATEIELRINGVSRFVPLTFAPQCGIELWAFFTD